MSKGGILGGRDQRAKVVTVELNPTKEPLGISLVVNHRKKVIVNKVAPNKPAHGKIFIGDLIMTVNGKTVNCLNDFGDALRSNQEGKHVFKVRRSKVNRFLGQEHEMLAHKQSGFDYLLVQMNISSAQMRKKPFGAAVTTWRQRAIIADIQADSVAQEYFEPFDRVLAVNGTPVNTADESAELFDESGGKLTILIERPLTDEKKELYANALLPEGEDNAVTERSIWTISEAKSDVIRIGVEEVARLKEDKDHQEPKPILKEKDKEKDDDSGKGVVVKEGHEEVEIRRDVDDDKPLIPVPRKS